MTVNLSFLRLSCNRAGLLGRVRSGACGAYVHRFVSYVQGPLFVSLYIFVNVLYNILIILILKYGSANLLWLALTLRVPLANIAFSFPFMPNATPMHSTDGWGLVVSRGVVPKGDRSEGEIFCMSL
jgi:hypothetical protein